MSLAFLVVPGVRFVRCPVPLFGSEGLSPVYSGAPDFAGKLRGPLSVFMRLICHKLKFTSSINHYYLQLIDKLFISVRPLYGY